MSDFSSTGGIDPLDPDTIGAPSSDLIISPTSDRLALFLLQVILILLIVRVSAKLLAKIRQPPVIGEILAGVILGPSILGYIPGFEDELFPLDSQATLNIFAQVGLIFFMFFLGLELDPKLFQRNWKVALPVSIISVMVPFGLGCAVSPLVYSLEQREEQTNSSRSALALFIGTTLAFTAFPLLARILTSFRLLGTAFGEFVLATAACDDVLAWCTLALTLSYATNSASWVNGIYTALITIAYLIVMVWGVRTGLHRLNKTFRFRAAHPDQLNRDYVCVLLLMLCASSIWTEISGIHAFFGAFIAGLIVPKDDNVVLLLAPKIELIIVEFFLPLYFAMSGLRTKLGEMNTGEVWGICLLITIVATLGKIIPVTLMTHFMTRYYEMSDDDFDPRTSESETTTNGKSETELAEIDAAAGSFDDDNYAYDAMKMNGSSFDVHKPANSNGSSVADGSHGSSDDPSVDINGNITSSSSVGTGLSNKPSLWSPERKRYSWRTCLSVGLLMNTTGLVTLIALNVGLDRGLIGNKVFSLMVLMALATTFMTSPIFNWLFYVPKIIEQKERHAEDRKKRENEAIKAGRDPESVVADEDAFEAARQRAEAEEEADADEEARRHSIAIQTSSKKAKKALKKQIMAPFDTVNQTISIHDEVVVRNESLRESLSPTTDGEVYSSKAD